MIRIGLLSDTHGYMDEAILGALSSCDQIWHAGDVGDKIVLEKLTTLGIEVKVVFGNIDSQIIRIQSDQDLVWNVEKKKILMTHIGGYPGHYSARIKSLITIHKPDIVVCGHSHILRVIFDKEMHHLHLNPGACGKEGFHKVRTLLRFEIDGDQIKQMNVVEWPRR